MEILWDEPKRLANLDKHRFDFRQLTADFFSKASIQVVKAGRFKAIGVVDQRLVAVIFAPLGREAISVISFRAASMAERRLYNERS